MVSKLGFYWDDWSIAYYIHFHGPSSFREAFTFDRPLMAWIYQLTTSLLGINPLNWQVSAIIARWLTSLALWWALRGIWPQKTFQVTAIAFLFSVYPGFQQQYIAITYGNAFLIYGLFLFSLATMVWAFRIPKWFWLLYFLSVISLGFVLFTAEYFVGLELLRPAFLWLMICESDVNLPQRIKRTILYWSPYVVLLILFLLWRITNETPRAEVTIIKNLSAYPIVTLIDLAKKILADLASVTAIAWKQVFHLSKILVFEPIIIIKYTAIVLVSGGLTVFYLLKLRNGSEQTGAASTKRKRLWALQIIILGVYALIIGGIPIWSTNLKISLSFPWDRFTLPMMIGASLLLLGLIEMITWRKYQSAILIGIVIGLAAGLHFRTALEFRKDWLTQRDFFWQLIWRAPGIKPGTTILTTEMPFSYDWDNSLTLPLNWMYAPNNQSYELKYLIYNIESRLSSDLPNLEENMPIREYIRDSTFTGSTSQAVLVIYRPPGSCLKVIDPKVDQQMPDKPRYYQDSFSFSDPNLIITDTYSLVNTPLSFFFPKPEHDWCYYYEKADLAKQQGNWEEVARLGDEAKIFEKDFVRKNVTELIPFIKGYGLTGRWDEAVRLSLTAYQASEKIKPILCDTWKGIKSDNNTAQTPLSANQLEEAYNNINQYLKCDIP